MKNPSNFFFFKVFGNVIFYRGIVNYNEREESDSNTRRPHAGPDLTLRKVDVHLENNSFTTNFILKILH